jgi:hypothetical protein
MVLEPANDLSGVVVRRKDRIEDMLDSPAGNDHRQAPEEPHAVHFEGRQTQGVTELKLSVAQDFERDAEAAGHLALVLGGLRAQAKHISAKL